MQIRFAATRFHGDVFGGGEAITVTVPEDSTGSFKFHEERFLPATAPQEIQDPFCGLGNLPSAHSAPFEKIILAPVPVPEDYFNGPAAGAAIKLAPIDKPDDYFENGAPFETGSGELGTFRKNAQQYSIGDRVRLRQSPDRTCVIRDVNPNGTIRCEEEGYPSGVSMAHVTFPENLIAA